jgi:hypothetical protein
MGLKRLLLWDASDREALEGASTKSEDIIVVRNVYLSQFRTNIKERQLGKGYHYFL